MLPEKLFKRLPRKYLDEIIYCAISDCKYDLVAPDDNLNDLYSDYAKEISELASYIPEFLGNFLREQMTPPENVKILIWNKNEDNPLDGIMRMVNSTKAGSILSQSPLSEGDKWEIMTICPMEMESYSKSKSYREIIEKHRKEIKHINYDNNVMTLVIDDSSIIECPIF